MAAPPREVEIQDRIRMLSTREGRVGKWDDAITYLDALGRTGFIIISSEDLEGKPDEEQVRVIQERIRAQVEERERWIRRKITI